MTNQHPPHASGTIRQLEWEDLGADYWRAPAPFFGSFRIEPWGNQGFHVLWSVPGLCDRMIADLFTSVEAAKAAAQADYSARILAAIQPDPQPVASEPVERVRHKKRGTEYAVIGRGLLQTDTPLTDYSEVVAYRGAEGDVWVRPASEFDDGRFEPLAATPSSAPASVAEAAKALIPEMDRRHREYMTSKGRDPNSYESRYSIFLDLLRAISEESK